MRVLLLGGTSEARALAVALTERRIDVISSLAGRVSNPALPVGATRIGGFGGVTGLESFVRTEAISMIVDATHPFAATITSHAVEVSTRTGVPALVLRRPGWTAGPGDRWTTVADITAAADAAASSVGGTVFLTTGRRDLAAFAGDAGHHYLVRTVDPPNGDVPLFMTLLLDRGPYLFEAEQALMTTHDVRLLVAKDSGGAMTAAKLAAARALGLPVVVVSRPPVPPGAPTVDSVDDAVTWLSSILGSAAE